MSDLAYFEPARFELRQSGKPEIREDDPRKLTLAIGHGNNREIFPMTESEVTELAQLLEAYL